MCAVCAPCMYSVHCVYTVCTLCHLGSDSTSTDVVLHTVCPQSTILLQYIIKPKYQLQSARISSEIQFNYTVCPKKTHFQCCWSWLNHHLLAPLVSGDWLFGHFLLWLSRIKRTQVMSMVKFSPIALNFGYDFVLLVYFFGAAFIMMVVQNFST